MLVWSLGYATILLLAALSDLRQLRIPNALPAALLALFLARALIDGLADHPLEHLAAFGLILPIGLACFAARLMGGGDVKLIAVVALWLGLTPLPAFLVLMAISGGVLGLSLLIARRWRPGTAVPYGVAIMIGGLLVEAARLAAPT